MSKTSLTVKECAEQFRFYAETNPSPDSQYSLRFCANFLEEFCNKIPELPLTLEAKFNYRYLVTFGGGLGEDVWDKERIVGAVDIRDVLNQMEDLVAEMGGQIFSIEQME